MALELFAWSLGRLASFFFAARFPAGVVHKPCRAHRCVFVWLHAPSQERKHNIRLPPEVNRVLYVRNLPFKITAEEMYDIFGKYGTIFQIRVGDKPDTRGTAFVVYDDIYDAKNAVDHLSGFNVCGRYLIVLYYQQGKMEKKLDVKQKRDELEALKQKYNLSKEDVAKGE